MRRRITVGLPIAALLLCAWPAPVLGQFNLNTGNGQGISVQGIGEVAGRPNVVEMDLHVSGKAELTGDALVKFRDAKKRLLEALDKVKLGGLTVVEHALSITVGNSVEQQQMVFNGRPQPAGKPQVEVSSEVRLTLTGIRDLPPEEVIKTVGRLLDTAADSGVSIGPSPAEVMRAMRFGQAVSNASPVRFVIADLSELREKAYEKAVADARRRASRLAKLHQVKLGSTLMIQEMHVAGDQPTNANVINNGYQTLTPGAGEYEGDEPRLVVSSLSGASIQVKLQVRFAIEGEPAATAQN